MTRTDADVVVVGGGMAGLVSAARALDSGAERVVGLEKGHRLGGSMAFSGGAIWTFGSYEELRELAPDGKAELQKLLADSLDGCFEWLAAQGVEFSEMQIDIPGDGRQIEPASFVETMRKAVEDAGGTVHLNTPMTRLRTDADGTVVGVTARDADGETVDVDAGAVVLATGGFQGNERLVQQYITDDPDRLWLRSNPWSTGDGFEAAVDVGAKVTTGLDTFYGHNMAAPPAEFRPVHFREASQYYGPKAIAVDANGERFADESRSENEETLMQATVERAGGRAYYVLDSDLYESSFHAGHVGTMVERAAEFGAPVVEADTLSDLGDAMAEWGVDGDRVVETVRTFNDAIERGAADALDPPRRRYRTAFDAPPYHAVAVQAGITFTMGGLDVTPSCEVVNRAESSSALAYFPNEMRDVRVEPIPGLYAAGTDVGNVMNYRYLGGLAVAVVTGVTAGDAAAERALAR